MNSRLLTPAIVLISFGAAFGVMGLRGAHTPAVPDDTASAQRPAPVIAALLTDPVPAPAPAPAPAPTAEPLADHPPPPIAQPQVGNDEPTADEQPASMTPDEQAQASDGFLDARDRATEHGARSH
ncbi:MAG TPA: hypothetical protein VMF03_10950 [Steroidobacteraceae bacterium]|nr:hypothetical protein [Steroidobacteraceae bacterium]